MVDYNPFACLSRCKFVGSWLYVPAARKPLGIRSGWMPTGTTCMSALYVVCKVSVSWTRTKLTALSFDALQYLVNFQPRFRTRLLT